MMDFGHNVGAGQTEHIVVAFHLSRQVLEPFSAEVGFREPIALDSCAQSAVKYDDFMFGSFLNCHNGVQKFFLARSISRRSSFSRSVWRLS